jgi:hypothetical protein
MTIMSFVMPMRLTLKHGANTGCQITFHHQGLIGCIDPYSINHYHKGWCKSFYA